MNVVVGNSSADLDSCASAVGLSRLLTQATKTPWTAVIGCSRDDMDMRHQQTYWLQKCRVQLETLVFIDELNMDAVEQAVLVDHNDATRGWESISDKVVGIVDHHADTKQLLVQMTTLTTVDEDSAIQFPGVRLISTAAGSCSSLVLTMWYASHCTLSYYTALLLSGAIVSDTKGFKQDLKGSRWSEIDSKAFYWLSHMYDDYPESDSIHKELKSIKDDDSLYSMVPLDRLLTMDMKTFTYGSVVVVYSSFPTKLKSLMETGSGSVWANHLAAHGALVMVVLGHGKNFREIGLFSTDSTVVNELSDHFSSSLTSTMTDVLNHEGLRVTRHTAMHATRKIIEPLVRSFFSVS